MLDEITLYWLTNTGASSSRFYWDNNNNFSAEAQKTKDIKAPVGITVFPKEIHQAPESWAKHAHPSLTYYRQVEKGKHFAAWEQPQLFAEEARATPAEHMAWKFYALFAPDTIIRGVTKNREQLSTRVHFVSSCHSGVTRRG